jgi:hypothetical protein
MASGLMLTALALMWRLDGAFNTIIKISTGLMGVLNIVQAARM